MKKTGGTTLSFIFDMDGEDSGYKLSLMQGNDVVIEKIIPTHTYNEVKLRLIGAGYVCTHSAEVSA